MDWLTFITEIIKALAWPLTVLLILLLLRQPIAELIPLLRKLKWKELELEFEEKLVELKSDAAEALPPPAEGAPEDSPCFRRGPNRLVQLAEQSPRAAIIEAWIAVERAAANAISRRLPEGDISWNDTQMGQMLASHEILDSQQLRIYNDLRQLRNQAAHHEDFRIDAERAADYVRIADGLALHIDRRA